MRASFDGLSVRKAPRQLGNGDDVGSGRGPSGSRLLSEARPACVVDGAECEQVGPAEPASESATLIVKASQDCPSKPPTLPGSPNTFSILDPESVVYSPKRRVFFQVRVVGLSTSCICVPRGAIDSSRGITLSELRPTSRGSIPPHKDIQARGIVSIFSIFHQRFSLITFFPASQRCLCFFAIHGSLLGAGHVHSSVKKQRFHFWQSI